MGENEGIEGCGHHGFLAGMGAMGLHPSRSNKLSLELFGDQWKTILSSVYTMHSLRFESGPID